MPELDKGFEVFVNWQTALFCLGIYFTTYIVRTIVESLLPSTKEKGTKTYKYWTELFLQLGPFGTGILIALFAKKFPWPMPVADSLSVKVLYGIVCGGASGWFYARFRAWTKADELLPGSTPAAAPALAAPAVEPSTVEAPPPPPPPAA